MPATFRLAATDWLKPSFSVTKSSKRRTAKPLSTVATATTRHAPCSSQRVCLRPPVLVPTLTEPSRKPAKYNTLAWSRWLTTAWSNSVRSRVWA